ncbi:hypothetical protein O5O45_25100 [Hahella aquimaris]|uniref:hypothetical protein n=1 Tax=Hahella sp. HNIBRBA332 TaxID=3015983 RepID=UPI00273ADD47|nr:hypothetical protein [Hahella sp. HNIBRBA332]WLQ13011.1 hypothetical protein O5O45_25100 [Hahella sp. HNIBRBA332]
MEQLAMVENASPSRGRLKLWGIILVAATPLIAAMVMYFGRIGIPSGTTNYGDLIIPPLDATEIGVSLPEARLEEITQADGKRQWLMLTVAGDACGERCSQALYLSRQINIALGKESDRVGRALLAGTGDAALQQVLNDYPRMLPAPFSRADMEGLRTKLNEHNIQLQPYDMLLMDPLGNIMMHYSEKHDGKAILEDLKRLLKVSKIG